MRRPFVLLVTILVVGGGGSLLLFQQIIDWQRQRMEREAEGWLPPPIARLESLHTRLGAPQRGDWLAKYFELGQTYEDYLREKPEKLDEKRRIVYLQPLGDLTDRQRKILGHVAEYLEAWIGLQTKIPETLPLSLVPESARRLREGDTEPQLLTTYIIREVLRQRVPEDAVVYMAITASDLWPGGSWNRVFGQASYNDHVGVWSLYCLDEPSDGDVAMRLCLQRAIKGATHEIGHTFSLWHCTLYECNMCGSNNLDEADRYPIWLCPHCLAKLCYATDITPERHFEQLIAFCKANGFAKEQKFYEKSLAIIRAK